MKYNAFKLYIYRVYFTLSIKTKKESKQKLSTAYQRGKGGGGKEERRPSTFRSRLMPYNGNKTHHPNSNAVIRRIYFCVEVHDCVRNRNNRRLTYRRDSDVPEQKTPVSQMASYQDQTINYNHIKTRNFGHIQIRPPRLLQQKAHIMQPKGTKSSLNEWLLTRIHRRSPTM